MKRIYLCLFFVLAVAASTAKPRIRVEKTPGGKSVDFILEDKDRPGTMTVLIDLKELYNCRNVSVGLHKFKVYSDAYRFLSLKADDESYGVGYNYSWRYYYGVLDPEVDTAFVYRMPCSTLRPQRVIRTVNVLDKYRKAESEQERLGFMFPMVKGDTVYAMRRGVVTQIERQQRKGQPDASFTTEDTSLQVEHPDGTTAWYITLDPDHILVEEGDEVFPSTPLALAGSVDGEHYKLLVQVHWLETNPAGSWEQDHAVRRRLFPRFMTTAGPLVPESGQVYTPVLTEEMQTAELTKKELKRWQAARKN